MLTLVRFADISLVCIRANGLKMAVPTWPPRGRGVCVGSLWRRRLISTLAQADLKGKQNATAAAAACIVPRTAIIFAEGRVWICTVNNRHLGCSVSCPT